LLLAWENIDAPTTCRASSAHARGFWGRAHAASSRSNRRFSLHVQMPRRGRPGRWLAPASARPRAGSRAPGRGCRARWSIARVGEVEQVQVGDGQTRLDLPQRAAGSKRRGRSASEELDTDEVVEIRVRAIPRQSARIADRTNGSNARSM